MSERSRPLADSNLADTRPAGARATGFASAVLLVVLLATCGWPGETQPLVDNTHVTSCETNTDIVGRTATSRDRRWSDAVAAVRVELPRVLPRQRRVDSWGLPPPRAPTC